jgi:hypothetical protein
MEKEIVARLMQMPKLEYEGLQTKVSKSVISGSEADVDFTVQYKNKLSTSGPAGQPTITTLPFQAHLERTTVEWKLRTVKPTGP